MQHRGVGLLLSMRWGRASWRSKMKEELREERESADERLVKKIRLDKKLTFRKVSHEKQYEYNELVRYKVQSAGAALSQPSPASDKARSLLQDGEKQLDIRQKNINS